MPQTVVLFFYRCILLSSALGLAFVPISQSAWHRHCLVAFQSIDDGDHDDTSFQLQHPPPSPCAIERKPQKSFTNEEPNNDLNRKLCVLLANQFPEESKAVASRLSLDLVDTENNLEKDQGNNNHNDDDIIVPSYESALCLIPWKETYALSIQILNEDTSSSASTKKKPSKRKRFSSSSAKSKPLFVDFCPPLNSKVQKRATGGTDLLVKAVGPRKGAFSEAGAIVWDLTAGLGQDALLLAKAGAQRVVLWERNKVIAALLDDALRRLKWLAETTTTTSDDECIRLSQQLSLQVGDARDLNSPNEEREDACDIAYLDPMFPQRQKSAAVKKNMQILQRLLESQQQQQQSPENVAASLCQREEEERALLTTARQFARHRIVVKRPIGAPVLGGDGYSIRPSYEIKGSVNRWDVYNLQSSSSAAEL